MISAEDFVTFQGLVNAGGQMTERQCQTYLEHAKELLIPLTVIEFLPCNLEDRNFFGTNDFQIGALVRSDSGREDNSVSLWELKAPQCPIMVRDDANNRYRPSPELVKAETQLLHYANEAQKSDAFRERWNIVDRDNVKIGGIVIGRQNTWAAAPEEYEAAHRSFAIRQKYFYQPNQMRLITWSRVLDFVDPT